MYQAPLGLRQAYTTGGHPPLATELDRLHQEQPAGGGASAGFAARSAQAMGSSSSEPALVPSSVQFGPGPAAASTTSSPSTVTTPSSAATMARLSAATRNDGAAAGLTLQQASSSAAAHPARLLPHLAGPPAHQQQQRRRDIASVVAAAFKFANENMVADAVFTLGSSKRPLGACLDGCADAHAAQTMPPARRVRSPPAGLHSGGTAGYGTLSTHQQQFGGFSSIHSSWQQGLPAAGTAGGGNQATPATVAADALLAEVASTMAQQQQQQQLGASSVAALQHAGSAPTAFAGPGVADLAAWGPPLPQWQAHQNWQI